VAKPAQTIEAYVGEAMDNASLGPTHWRVLALVASGYFVMSSTLRFLGRWFPI